MTFQCKKMGLTTSEECVECHFNRFKTLVGRPNCKRENQIKEKKNESSMQGLCQLL